ncbi:MAG: chalcone isomerase family protein [Gammaproteobacteria bacterium]|nr:chalcone isomerase family protein [Gammaproteobacteria bacterium]
MNHKGMQHLLIIIALLLSAGTAQAVDKSDLPQSIDTGNARLQLCGSVTLRALGLIKFGYAGLYLDQCAQADAVLQGSVAQQYSVLLTRDAEGERLRDMALDSLADNFDQQALAARSEEFNCMTDAYANTPEGSRIDVRFEPARGLRMLVDDAVVADCGGDDEAAGYFSIWFGAEPFNETMRDKLLSQALANAETDNDEAAQGSSAQSSAQSSTQTGSAASSRASARASAQAVAVSPVGHRGAPGGSGSR